MDLILASRKRVRKRKKPGTPEIGRSWTSTVVSETSSSLRETSIGPLMETRAFVLPVFS